jgi:glycosyltransferase involved in cell wall biosynthesis
MKDGELEQTLPDTLWPGGGTACYLKGYARSATPLKSLGLEAPGLDATLASRIYPHLHGIDKCCDDANPKACLMSAFTSLLKVSDKTNPATYRYILNARFGGKDTRSIASAELTVSDSRPVETTVIPFAGSESGQRCVICMATYEPGMETFRRQIESIRAQTHKTWHCIINDDGSSDETLARCREVIGGDERFSIYRNQPNVGFYKNFETALMRVPNNADFVALSDQDDDWYPDKLESCLNAFNEKTQLVYCDMQIVNEQGEVLADTYWKNRRNNYQDAHVLFLANTVTGAASVFRRELLDDILPFPQPVGQVFHDHWIACVARCRGELGYVDRPLYDYYQYGTSVIGHCDFEHVGVLKGATGLIERAKDIPGTGRFKSVLVSIRNKSINIYHNEYLRLHLFAVILDMRMPGMNPSARRELTMFADNWRAVWRMLYAHLRIKFAGDTTYNAELRLAASVLAFKAERMLVRLFAGRLVRKHCRRSTAE